MGGEDVRRAWATVEMKGGQQSDEIDPWRSQRCAWPVDEHIVWRAGLGQQHVVGPGVDVHKVHTYCRSWRELLQCDEVFEVSATPIVQPRQRLSGEAGPVSAKAAVG